MTNSLSIFNLLTFAKPSEINTPFMGKFIVQYFMILMNHNAYAVLEMNPMCFIVLLLPIQCDA